MKVRANGIDIEVEDTGGEGRPVMLLIMGLGMQLVAWPDNLVRWLVDAGYRVVRHDNRDAGLSQAFDELGTGNLLWQGLRYRLGLQVRSAYTLQDMAGDSLGVLDALGIRRAHVMGASMGGMIAQRVAATAPERVASLLSVMSSSGARGLPGPRPDVQRLLMRRPAGTDEAALVAHSVRLVKLIAGPVFPPDEAVLRERLVLALRRAYRPRGLLRQIVAVAADRDRAAVLERIASPTLVLHGDADPLVPVACGLDTARRIPGARFALVPG
ncbi:MAG TPA: alpha/beta hydrolase, partial [Variovorax sp.]|nr:alpha/beta hydrolase [Variovorax sp.]